MSKINIFFFPFAGGNINSYNLFKHEIEKKDCFNFIPVEYPGRGLHYSEPLIYNISDLVNYVYDRICDKVNEAGCFFYGHSMGGLVAYLVIRKIELEKKISAPLCLFVSGCVSPEMISKQETRFHTLRIDDFIDKIISYGGVPEEIQNERELLYLLEPIIRADFTAYEKYQYNVGKIHVPIVALHGKSDNLKIEDVLDWQNESTVNFEYVEFEGGHFFIYDNINIILQIIYNKYLL